MKLGFIRPEKPIENAYTENFNGRLRQECLKQFWFSSLEDAKIRAWRTNYNEDRPHTSLGNQTPTQFEAERQLSRTAKEGIFKPPAGSRLGRGSRNVGFINLAAIARGLRVSPAVLLRKFKQ